MRYLSVLALILVSIQPSYTQNLESLIGKARAMYNDSSYAESAKLYESAFKNRSFIDPEHYYNAACSFSLSNNSVKALKYLNLAFVNGYKDISRLIINPDLNYIRSTREYTSLLNKNKEPNTIYIDDFFKMLTEDTQDSIVRIENKNIKLDIPFYGVPSEHYKNYIANNIKNVKYDSGRIKINKYLEISNCNIYDLFLQDLDILRIDIVKSKVVDINIRNVRAIDLSFWNNQKTSSESNIVISDSEFDGLSLYDNQFDIFLTSLNVNFYFDLMGNTGKTVYITNSNISFGNPASITGEVEKLRISYSQFNEVPFEIYEDQYESEFTLTPLPEAKGNLIIGISAETLEIRESNFNCDVIISPATVSKSVEIQDNTFNGYFDSYLANLPEFNKYVPFDQFKMGLAVFNFVPADVSPDGANCNYCIRYTGQEDRDIENTESITKLIQSNQSWYNHYTQSQDSKSANLVYTVLQRLILKRLGYISSSDGGFSNYFKWRKAQVSLWYYENTGLAISLLSLIIILLGGGIIWKIPRKKKVDLSEKRLAAIVFSDIVGYTQMMGQDEKNALKTIKVNNTVHQAILDRYNGKLLKEMGDGILFSFGSATDSVNFCIDVQKQIVDKNYKIRMGIHLGEVMFSNNDVFGDGVNIASRLQAKAESGCICISDTVYQNIRNLPEIQVEFLGEGDLKNVTSKMKMYNVRY